MNILVLNCGSSSLRFQLIDTDAKRIETDADKKLARGYIERIGSQALITLRGHDGAPQRSAEPLRDHRAALDFVLRWLVSEERAIPGLKSLADIHAVGHRVVHGGEALTRSVRIDDSVLRQIEATIDLAPLHNPANLRGIAVARELLGSGVPQVAVFDTAFHATLPERSYLYALPYQLYRRHRLRRYGFHGTSHRYVAWRYGRLTQRKPDDVTIVNLHLGNGCSACAIKEGKSWDTSMGLTPLEGLVMGTRSGDVDPSVVEFLHYKEGLSLPEIDTLLNKQSGLLGLSGLTHDMRELLAEESEHGDRRARLAIDVFCARARKYVGGYLAELGGAQAVTFTGGIGENSAAVRARICEGLEWMGLTLDAKRNAATIDGREGEISARGSRLKAYVIPTDEELIIARDTLRAVTKPPRG